MNESTPDNLENHPPNEEDRLLVPDEEEIRNNRRIGRLYLTAHCLALTLVLQATYWTAVKLGGFSWSRGSAQIFNWHPVMMVLAFALMTVASLAFRHARIPRKRRKLLHGMAWTVAAISASVGVTAVVRSHNNPGKYMANMYSLHSWIGALVILVYLAQLIAGTTAFGLCLSGLVERAPRILRVHQIVGPMIYYATALTILLGIQEKEGFIGCAYTVSTGEADSLWPSVEMLPSACRHGHALGLLVVATTICTALVLHTDQQPRRVE